MNEKEFEQEMNEVYFNALDAAKYVKPCSAEWDLIWGVLDKFRDYYEEKKRDIGDE